MIASDYMSGGSLQAAILDPAGQLELRWRNRCDAHRRGRQRCCPALTLIHQCCPAPARSPAVLPALHAAARRVPAALHRGRHVALDVAEGLAYLHGSLGVMHSDLVRVDSTVGGGACCE